jgi:hypothetical protein
MRIGRAFGVWAVPVLVLAAGSFFFFRMYRADIGALKGFIRSYDRFDQAMPGQAGEARHDDLGPAEEALAELQARASLRLSSLIKNDAALMAQARDVADLSRREFEAASKVESHEEYRSLHEKRRAAYARFRELGGVR